MAGDAAPKMLSIHVVQGEILLNASSESSHPYVLLEYGKHELQTESERATVDPVWDARFEVPVRVDATFVRFWIFSANQFEPDTLLGKVDVDIDVAAALRERFVVDMGWLEVEPVELSSQDRLRKMAKARWHGMGDLTAYVFSTGDRHLFDVYEKQGSLGRLRLEITPCSSDDDIPCGFGYGCGVTLGSCVGDTGPAPEDPPLADDPVRGALIV